MENITEKKWFVYLGDRHEGPHTPVEIQDKVKNGLIESEGFVWTEGMDDWERMTDCAQFQSILKHRPLSRLREQPVEIKEAPTRIIVPAVESESEKQTMSRVEVPLFDENPISQSLVSRRSTASYLLRIGFFGLFLLAFGGVYRLGYLEPLLSLPGVKAVGDSVGDWSRPYLLKASERFSFLSSWVSPIPRLGDVSPEDFEELKQVASANFKQQGPRFAVALSQSHPGSPSFYISTNIPEAMKLQVWIVGVPDTLLNQLSYVSSVEGSVSKKLGKTDVVRYPDGRIIPRGEYRVYLAAADHQAWMDQISSEKLVHSPDLPNGMTILLEKSYFLAGTRDSSYRDRLRDFHEKLRARASGELIEIKQFMLTLASQLDSTQERFTNLVTRKLSSKEKKSWENFHQEWTQLQVELDQIFQKWSPEVIKSDYFYEALYQLVRDLGHAVTQVHDAQNGYFIGLHHLGESQALAQSEAGSATQILERLKSKIERAEKLPPTPLGMPQREGI